MRRCSFAARRLDVCVGRSRKEPGAPAAQQPSTRIGKIHRYRTVWGPRQGGQDGTVYPGVEVDHAQCSCSCSSLLLLLAVPHAHPCLPHAPAPCPRRAAPARFLVVNRHRHTVPLHQSSECAVYVPKYPRGPPAHCPHTLAQATPKTIHQSRYQTKTDQASSLAPCL